MQDPISDMITRIRNAQLVSKDFVTIPLSKTKVAIASVLKEEGYITNFEIKSVDEATSSTAPHKNILITLNDN